MTSKLTTKPPIWFWIVSVLALLWNAMGVMQYLGQAYNTEAFRANYTAEQLDLITNTPAWVVAAFAIAVFGGVLGCLLLLFRKKLAYTLFLISLIGVVIQMIYNLFIAKSVAIYGPSAVVMTLMIIVIALSLLRFSKLAVNKNWIA